MTVYDLIYSYLDTNQRIPQPTLQNKVYKYKINGKSRSIKLDHENKLGFHNAYLFAQHNSSVNDSYDFHGMLGVALADILDAILDYHYDNKRGGVQSLKWITGNGKVIKPKIIRYLKQNNVRFTEINSGSLQVHVE